MSLSVILGAPKSSVDLNNDENNDYSKFDVVHGSIIFVSNKMNNNGTFNSTNCKNGCKGLINSDNTPPTIHESKKYIEWIMDPQNSDQDTCKPYKQYYMIEDKEIHPNYPNKQHTHEQHISDNYNLPLVLGLTLGLGFGLPLLLYLLIRMKK